MQITRATEYAVRCVLHLALEPADRVVPRREIAVVREIPEQFLGKIAQRLARAGIIRIHQGARGGYKLVVPASQISLLMVVEAAEGELILNTCVMHPRTCSRASVCAAHRVWSEARRQLRAMLGGVSFAELAAQERPLPQAGGGPAAKKAAVARRRGGAERGPPENGASTCGKCSNGCSSQRSTGKNTNGGR